LFPLCVYIITVYVPVEAQNPTQRERERERERERNNKSIASSGTEGIYIATLHKMHENPHI